MRETKERIRNQLALARLVSLQFQDTRVGIERPPQVPSGRAKWALQWTLEWVARTGERLTAEACREYLCGMFPDVFTRPPRPTDGTFIAIKYNGNTWSKRTMQTKMSEARAAMASGPAVKSDRQKRRREPRKRKKR
jgi:hypothetical protein